MCGVAGIYGHPEAAKLVALMLQSLRHRGQDSCGIMVYDGEGGQRFHREPKRGSPNFTEAELLRLRGTIAIGHVRYPTSGGSSFRNTQPFYGETRFGAVGLAHNGQLINAQELRKAHMLLGSVYQSSSDTEVLLHLLSRSGKESLVEALVFALSEVRGSYSLLTIAEDKRIIAFRDPYGFRPLSLGMFEGCPVIVSETCALNDLGGVFVRDIAPGEMVSISSSGIDSVSFVRPSTCSHCIFEHVYFSRPDSIVNGLHVSAVREKCGEILAREAPVSADVVVPVVEGGNHAAQGFSLVSGIRLQRGLIRKRGYGDRTFIKGSDILRRQAVRLKYSADPAVFAGKRAVLVDDSIVRGITCEGLIEMVRNSGATEVHLRIASPPFKSPCLYGIDTPEKKELLAGSMTEEEMRVRLGVDSLKFISVEGLLRAAGETADPEKSKFDTACFTGNYRVL